MRALPFVLFLCLFLCACSRRPNPEELKQADAAFARATAERGLEGFTSFLADDVMTIRPNTPVLKGSKALAERWAPLLRNPALSITWQPLEAAISEGGDLGFTIGSYQVSKVAGDDKSPAGSGKYITVWKRQPDGRWKVAFDSGVQDVPPAKPAP